MNKQASKLAEIETNWLIPNYTARKIKKIDRTFGTASRGKKALEEVEMDWLAAQEELEAMLQA